MYLGAVLMLMELMAPGFVIFFFGLSAATVGLLRFAFGEGFDLTWQLSAFSVFSVMYIIFLRRWMQKIFTGKVETSGADLENPNLGRLGKVTISIKPPLPGRVMVGDAEWAAEADTAVEVGANVRVVAQNNLTMKVEAV
jgi:hypothetical protein